MAAQSPSIGIREIVFDSLTTQSVLFAGLASASAFLLSYALGWPGWAMTIATILPFLPLVARQTRWTAGVSVPLAVFYSLVVTQGAHFGEHFAQMIQIHLMGRQGMAAMGLISPLNMEWVHFLWNAWVLVALILLARWFRGNTWIWVALGVAVWHVIEHLVIMEAYLSTGQMGDPGILARGGMIGDGVGLTRPDLHFLYNVLVTTPILIAFVVQVRQTRQDTSLERGAPMGQS